MAQTFAGDFFFPAQNFSLLVVQLYRLRHETFQICQC